MESRGVVESSGKNFKEVFVALLAGKPVKREGWIVPYKYVKAFRAANDNNLKKRLYAGLKGPFKKDMIVEYTPSNEDLFATDWIIYTAASTFPD